MDREMGPRDLAKQTREQEAAQISREKIEGRKKSPWMWGRGGSSLLTGDRRRERISLRASRRTQPSPQMDLRLTASRTLRR